MDEVKSRLAPTMASHLRRLQTLPDEATAVRYYQRNHLRFLQDLPPGAILDVGCGLGDFLAFAAANLDREALGLDLSAENVAACRDRGLNAQQADVLDLLGRDERNYAAIVLNDVLEHFEKDDLLRLLELLHRRLCPDGRLIVKVPNMANPLTATRARFADFSHALGFTEQSIVQVLEATGFRQVHLAPVDIYVTRNPVLNLVARAAVGVQHFAWRVLYRLNGVTTTRILTKSLMACAVK